MYCIHICRIDHTGVIKVADFGLSEDMYGSDYFRHRPGKDEAEDEERMLNKWMAPESLEDNIYTEATDVVSS